MTAAIQGRSLRGSQALPLIAMFQALLALGACSDASGCEDFGPRSESMATGETVQIDLLISNGAFDSIDVAAGIYATEETIGPAADPATILVEATATLVNESLVLVEIPSRQQTVEYTGPIACE